MRRLVLILPLLLVGCREPEPPPINATRPAATAPAPSVQPHLQVDTAKVDADEWIPIQIPVALSSPDAKIPKGDYYLRVSGDLSTASPEVRSFVISPTAGESKGAITVSTVGYSVLPETSARSSADLRGGDGKATLWVRLAGTNGEWGSAIFDVDPSWRPASAGEPAAPSAPKEQKP